MTIEALTGSRAWLAAGWTMLHFLWVGGAIGLVAALGRRALCGAAPATRYGFALLCLSAMAVAPAAIALVLPAADDGPLAPTVPRAADDTPLPFPSAVRPPPERPAAPREPATDPLRWAFDRPTGGATLDRCLETAAAGLPWLWIVGTPSTFALLAAGLVGADRLRRRSRPLPDGELTELARRLASAIGIVRPVALGVCDRLAAPILLGIVRPMILLPAAAVTGWGPDQLEMALLHELAHVRRFDNLVNLGQRVIESLLFFHPAVWWASGWVRLEREHCCDRLVVARTGRARPYAAMLAELAMHRNRPGRAAVAMAESPIVARIRCILNPEDHLMPLSRPVVALAIGLLAAPALLIASQAGAPGPGAVQTTQPQGAGAPGKIDRARIDEFLIRTRHAADMFLDVQGRAYTLMRIAQVQARAGDREAARRTFQQAEQLAERVGFDDSRYSPHILLWIVQAETRHGFRDEAIAAARKLLQLSEAPLKHEIRKTDLYTNLLRSQVELGDRVGVEQTLRAGRRFFTTSKEPGFKEFAPIHLVQLQAASGDMTGALRMTRDPELLKQPNAENSSNLRHGALFAMVQEIKPGDRETARPVLEVALQAVAADIDPLPWRGMTIKNGRLQEIAMAQARIGLFDEAIQSARMIDAETIPGQLADARKADFRDEQRWRKAMTLADISLEQAKAGDTASTWRSAKEAGRIVEAIEGGQ